MFRLKITSSKSIQAEDLEIGEFAIIVEEGIPQGGELICRIYDSNPDNVTLVSVTNPNNIWRGHTHSLEVKRVNIEEIVCSYV